MRDSLIAMQDIFKEIEMDAVASNGVLTAYVVSEHIEHAGVHSGDATIVTPPQKLYFETVRRVIRITRKIAKAFNINGPFNIQFLAKDNEIRVIELNLRASRSFPFVSKVFSINLIDLATRTMMGEVVEPLRSELFQRDYVAVKSAQFSFNRLQGADPTLGVEMASTGEVACFGDHIAEAFLKSFLAVGNEVPTKSVLLSTGPIESKAAFLQSARILEEMRLKIYATEGTHAFLTKHGIEAHLVAWPLSDAEKSVLDLIKAGEIDLVINIPKSYDEAELTNGYLIRRTSADYAVTLITNLQIAELFVSAISKHRIDELEVRPWDAYAN